MFKVHKRKSKEAATLDKESGVFPSEFVATFMNMPVGGQLSSFSFQGRRYLVPIYDTPHPRVLLQCGRQVEKSTTLGNITLTYTILRKHFRSLFVSPTQQQTETFSRDKLSTPIEISDKIQAFTKGAYTKDNVLFKKFITGSDITLRYAFLHADRVRGISADMLLLDEMQDILTEVIPVIEEALSHSYYKILRYSGTPKSLDNTISYYWENFSTQNEWLIPCDRCGGGDYRHWNTVTEKSIGKKSLICDKCGNQIFPNHPDARWVSMNPNPAVAIPFEGYRIPQPIAAWVDWNDIVDKRKRYSKQQFYNEVLGLGYNAGDRPLTKQALQACCSPNVTFDKVNNWVSSAPIFMGVDWGTAENSYTVMTLGTYVGGKFQVFYAKRFEGEDAEPPRQLEIISQYVERFRVAIIGTDYGGGFDRNDALVRKFGIRRVAKYQYAGTKKKLVYENGLNRWIVNRTAVLMDLINAINRGKDIAFPCWQDFEHPFGQDMVNLFSEYNESRRMTVLNKTPGATDDTLHAFTYCFLASTIRHPRPDIFTPVGD